MTWTYPHCFGHQRLLVRSGSGFSETSDLRGKRVCAAINPLTGLWPVQLNNRSVPVDKGGIEKCFAALQRGEVDVVTGPDIALLSVIEPSSDYRLAGDQLTTEGYGAMVAPGAVNAAQFVNNVMNAAKADGSFDRWYRRWIGPRYNGALPGPPRFSAEEVAAFFPEEPTESG